METLLYVPQPKAEAPGARVVLRVWQVRWDLEPGRYRCIVGQVKNESSHHLDWVRVEFPLLNGADEQVGTASDCILSLEAGKTWAFRVPVFTEDVTRMGLPTLKTELGKLSSTVVKSRPGTATVSDLRYQLEIREPAVA